MIGFPDSRYNINPTTLSFDSRSFSKLFFTLVINTNGRQHSTSASSIVNIFRPVVVPRISCQSNPEAKQTNLSLPGNERIWMCTPSWDLWSHIKHGDFSRAPLPNPVFYGCDGLNYCAGPLSLISVQKATKKRGILSRKEGFNLWNWL